MKLLLLSDLNSIHTKKWVEAISKKDCEVCVFGLGKPKDNFYDTLKNVKVHYSDFQNQYGKSGIGKTKYLKVIGRLRKIYKDFAPDIVHAHYATSYGLLGTFLRHKPYLISVWGEDVFSFPKESFIKRVLFKRNLRKAHHLFSTSKVMAIEAGLYTKKTVHVVPFGVDTDYFKKMDVPGNEQKFVIGIVKTLEDKYGINYLIDAFDKVVKANASKEFELLIVGGGRKEQELKDQVTKLNLNDLVNFVGSVPHKQVPEYFNKMDVVVVPSILNGESFGVAAVEASACERPVVVSNIGGLPEVVIDGETGLICPIKDSDSLAEKINFLVDNEELCQQFGKRGRQNVIEKYDWKKNVDLMMSHYDRILREKS